MSGSSCSFGLSTVGGFNGSIAADTKKVTQYTAVACNITKLTGYVSGGNVGGGPQHVRAVVYADNGGVPGARLAVSNEVNVAQNQAAGWVDFPLPASVSISAGPIWMGYIGSSPNIGIPKYDGTGVAVRYNTDTYSDGASDPFGTSTAGVVATYSLYATGDPPPLSERVGINTPNVATEGWDLFWGQTVLNDDGIHLFRDSAGPLNIWATQGGNPNWQYVDTLISFVKNVSGGELLPIMHGSNPWQHPSCTPGPGGHGYNCPPDPAYYTEWANEVVAVVDHLVANGVAVPEIQIWNEPYCCGFWQPQSNVAAYLNLVKAVLPIVWAAYPNMKVLVSANYWEEGSTCEANPCPQWAGPLFAADTIHALNDPRVILDVHDYMQNLSPQTDRSIGWDWTRYLDIRSIAQSYGKTSPHFEITEMGWEANDGYCQYCVTPAQQSQYTTDALKIAFEDACACVDRIFPFEEYRGSNTGNTGRGWGYNYHLAGGTARPVAGAVKSYINANIP